jgi:hypothetical protein
MCTLPLLAGQNISAAFGRSVLFNRVGPGGGCSSRPSRTHPILVQHGGGESHAHQRSL